MSRMPKPLIKWWGYRHVNGGLHLKRFFKDAIKEARSSDFVEDIYGPFIADSREEAEKKLKEIASKNSFSSVCW